MKSEEMAPQPHQVVWLKEANNRVDFGLESDWYCKIVVDSWSIYTLNPHDNCRGPRAGSFAVDEPTFRI